MNTPLNIKHIQLVFRSKWFYFNFIGEVAVTDSPRNNQHQYGEVTTVLSQTRMD